MKVKIFLKLLRQSDGRGIILQLCAIQLDQSARSNQEASLTDGLGPLLTEFMDLFDTPTGLPPPRSHDHRIPLQRFNLESRQFVSACTDIRISRSKKLSIW